MKAIILAAGRGNRLRPLTDKLPKTLIPVKGQPILSYLLNGVSQIGCQEVILCTGYKQDEIIRYCQDQFALLKIRYILNSSFEKTNNLYSLFLARDHFDDDLLIVNGDVLCDMSVFERVVQQPGSCVAVDEGAYDPESMKVLVSDGWITSISKEIQPEAAFGCSIDLYKIARHDLEILKSETEKMIGHEKRLDEWTEAMLDRLFKSGRFKARSVPIGDAHWYEIDDLQDLEKAESLFATLPAGGCDQFR